MFIGQGQKLSKTERVFFPPPGLFKKKHILPASKNGRMDELIGRPKTVRAKEEENLSQMEKEYNRLAEAILIIFADDFISFCTHFKYIGSCISFLLRADYDVGHQIVTANMFLGALARFWDDHQVDMHSKYMIFRAIAYNLLLWGCESWALLTRLLNKI